MDNDLELQFQEGRMPREMGWRISISILTAVAWLAFVIAWLFFLAEDHTIWENLGLLILSLAILIAVNAGLWIPFGMRFAPQSEKKKMASARSIASAAIGVAACIFLIYWLFNWADDYSIYQNMAVLLMVLVIGGGTNAAIWAGQGHRRC